MTRDGTLGTGSTIVGRALTCREVVELVTAYLEEALDETDRALMAQHLAACEDCTTYLDQMRQTVEFLGELSADGLTPETRQQLLAQFRSWRSA